MGTCSSSAVTRRWSSSVHLAPRSVEPWLCNSGSSRKPSPTPSLPLTVGIGLDAGEAVAVEGGYRGGALNVAARLCSLARAGEVLASREIVHLALRVDGVRFTERGQAALKGLEKPVHVVAVRSEDRDDALAIAPFVRSIAPPPRARWKTVAAVVAFVVVAALVAIPLVARRGQLGESNRTRSASWTRSPAMSRRRWSSRTGRGPLRRRRTPCG